RAVRAALRGGRRRRRGRARGMRRARARGGARPMKITARFQAVRPGFALAVAAALWTAALAFSAAAAWLALEAVDIHGERPRLEGRLARVEEQLAAAGPRAQMPPAADIESLRRRVEALNKLSGMRGWGTPQLLGWLGKQLPDNVYLVSL